MSTEAINWDRYWFRTSAKLPNEGEVVLIRDRFNGEVKDGINPLQPQLATGLGTLIEGQWWEMRSNYWDKLQWGDKYHPVPEGWRRLGGLPERTL